MQRQIRDETNDIEMTIDDFINKIEQNFEGMVKGLPKKLNEFAFDLSSQIVERVGGDGINKNGNYFSKYSNNPAYFPKKYEVIKGLTPWGKRNKEGKRRKVFKGGKKEGEEHKTVYFQNGYDGWKTALGRNQIGNKNFLLTGQMWRGYGIINKAEIINGSVRAKIGAKGDYSRKLIEHHNEEESYDKNYSITDYNKEEEAILIAKTKEYIVNALKIGL